MNRLLLPVVLLVSILPARAFVFCCFNDAYKIQPDVFEVWMRLLAQVPDSVLWLSPGRETASANLRREAAARGDWRELFRQVDRIDKVTKEDIRRVANKTFVAKNRTVGRIETQAAPAPKPAPPSKRCASAAAAPKIFMAMRLITLPYLIHALTAALPATNLASWLSPSKLELRWPS